MSKQIIDCLPMCSMTWLRAHLNYIENNGYTIDSVVVSDGEVIIVHHLATATPELLEALKSLLLDCEVTARERGHRPEDFDNIRQARAVIAKAEGK